MIADCSSLKICFILTHTSRGSAGSFVRIHQICKHLTDKNVQVTIFTPFSEDLGDKQVDIRLLPNKMSRGGFSSLAYKIARKMASSSLTSKLFLSEASISRMVDSLKNGIRHIQDENKFDVIHAVQPIAGLAAAKVAREYDIPLVVDLHNIWPEEVVTHGFIKRDDEIFNRLRGIEQEIFNSADAITVVSDFMKSYMMENYSVSNKITVVPPAGQILDLPKEQSEKNVVYAGMVNFREHVDLFAESIPLIKTPASFFISKHGDAIEEIRKVTSRPRYPEVNYFWFPERQDLLNFLMRSRVGVLTSINDITRQIGPPLKLFDYMSCGLPVVANRIGGWSEIIEKEQIGMLIDDNSDSFAECVDMLLNDDSMWHKMRQNTQNLVKEKYNWESVAQKILMPLYSQLSS